ncbi:TonB-dependent receptor [Luteolibacter luteus]|uniref:TonB-dependent receptor n=1 Tax=Luteolibacter luteus TaxID=2728835 RepID=A0A858RFM7_9BACT|nr:TonB-dependent receptor [Luteolibacter luteus]QJE95647.1 TonB-dependent receptor [Luteolibacter luteus]
MRIRTSLLLLTATFTTGIGISSGEPPAALDETIVNAPREATDGQREADFAIPLPGGRGYQEILPSIPNAQQGTPSSTAFTLRGLGQDNVIFYIGTQSNTLVNFSNGGVPATASSLTSVMPLMWDIDQVIVERGPILFGRGVNAMGGEIRLEPRAPQFFHEGRITGEVADYGSWRAGITENMVLVEDKLALRLNAVGEGTDGAVTNVYDGNERFAETQRSSFRSQLRWRPGGDDSSVFDWRVDVDRGRGNSFGQAFQPANGDIFARIVDVNTTPTTPADQWATMLRGRLELERDWWVESEASFSIIDAAHHTDFDGSSMLDWFYTYTIDERRLTGSTRFGQDKEGFNWFGGVYAEASEYGIVFEGRGLGPIPQGRPFRTKTGEDVGIAAAFAHAELELAHRFWLTGGLRLDYQSREQSIATKLNGVSRGADRLDADYTEWLPELGTEWRGDDITAGAKISRAYRPGGIAVAPSLGLANPYGPERGWETNLFVEKNWECIRANARVFYAWLDDQQVPYVPRGGFPVVDNFVTNSAESQRAGAEVEMVWKNGDFSAGVMAGYLYAEYDQLVLNGVNRAGQAFPLSPEWNAAIGFSWKPETGWFGETSFNWADTTYSQADSPIGTKLEARLLWSARTGYRWNNVEAYIFGSNLLDEEYALSRSDYRAVGLPISGKLGMPRVIGTGVTITW